MAEVSAQDISIEDWSGSLPGTEYANYICSFGLTKFRRKQLSRIADYLQVALIFVENDSLDPLTDWSNVERGTLSVG